jgi:membrane-associated phospholipid phosphatase
MWLVSGMQSDQDNQSDRKGNVVLVLVIIGAILVSILSFFGDQSVIDWMQAHRTPAGMRFAGLVSKYGDWPGLTLYGAIAFLVAWWRKSRVFQRIILGMLVALAIEGAVQYPLCALTGRARPNNIEAKREWNGPWRNGKLAFFDNKIHSFPSGHTGGSFAFFGALFFAWRRYGWLFLPLAALIGWSRIYLNVHHLSDVVVGMFLGLFISWLVTRWFELRSWHVAGRAEL